MSFPENEVQRADAGVTHAVDILAFVEAQEIPSTYFEQPYYLSPEPGGEHLYALLRETLRSTRKVGIACVVIQARQHLAALVPEGQSLVLQTLRWKREERWLGAMMPAEQTMKAKKSEEIVLRDTDALIDEDELIDDDFLEFTLGRKPHAAIRQSSRAGMADRRTAHVRRARPG